MYTKDFKEKAVIEYESGKSANQIFQKAEIDILILSKRYDYASKIISKCRAANRKKINIHYPKRKCKQKKSANQKLLERNKGARGIRRIKMDLEDIHGKIMNRKKISRIMKELNLRTKK